jgi:hypothetical protein
MKVFKDGSQKLDVGQRAEDFPIGGKSFLSNLKESPIFLVFWKTV